MIPTNPLSFVIYNLKSHDTIFDEVLAADEEKDADRHKDLRKAKLTMTECVLALAIALALVTVIAYYLIKQIDPLVEDFGVSENFMGLILVPLVEKAAEHLTAIDEAWDNQMVKSPLPPFPLPNPRKPGD